MFTIDLLKGEGLPAKGRAQRMAVAAIASAVPVVLAIAMFGFYLHNRVSISIQNGEITRQKAKTAELSEAVELQKSLEREKVVYGTCMAEVKTAVGMQTQWSPILEIIVASMPDSVVLTALEVKQTTVRKTVPSKDDPETTISVSVPVPTLQMSVAAMAQSDNAIRSFRDKLRSSVVLGPKLENITVSQRADKLGGLDVVSYEINCIFKPKIKI